ncbi:hypothetical protein N566_24705 [Streptomycetaceae bacterium MP113-05]|nr:hypothetical protein N566_24705 [Streptomycetaceae bacterium MP113-05]
MRELVVDGLSYSYRMLHQPSADTDPVIILGGALQGMFGWPHMEDHIQPLAHLVTADLPGMGGSDPLREDQESSVLCRAVGDIIDDLGVERVNLFGYSYGAAIAFGCAQRMPHRIARLLLGGVPAHITAAQQLHWRRAADQLASGKVQSFAATAAAGMLCLDERLPVQRRDLAHRYVKRSLVHAATRSPHALEVLDRALNRRLSLSGGLSGVRTLVMSGAYDTVSSPARQRAFAATIADSSFLTIAETDHWAVLQRPDEVADIAARFFTDRPLPRAEPSVGRFLA